MGIFAENAWFIYQHINKDPNGLTAFCSITNSWHVVITRQYEMDVPLEIKRQTGSNTWTYIIPEQRYWDGKKKDFPFYAVYIVPWSTMEEGDGSYGMIKMVDHKLDNYMTRNKRLNVIHIHKFMSKFQYPFLEDIKKISDCFFYLHKIQFKKNHIDRLIIETALHPKKLQYYLLLGYSIDDWCS